LALKNWYSIISSRLRDYFENKLSIASFFFFLTYPRSKPASSRIRILALGDLSESAYQMIAKILFNNEISTEMFGCNAEVFNNMSSPTSTAKIALQGVSLLTEE